MGRSENVAVFQHTAQLCNGSEIRSAAIQSSTEKQVPPLHAVFQSEYAGDVE